MRACVSARLRRRREIEGLAPLLGRPHSWDKITCEIKVANDSLTTIAAFVRSYRAENRSSDLAYVPRAGDHPRVQRDIVRPQKARIIKAVATALETSAETLCATRSTGPEAGRLKRSC